MKKHHFAIMTLIILATAGGAFYGGDAYAKSKIGTPNAFAAGRGLGPQGQSGAFTRGGMAGTNGGLTDGEVLKKDDTSLTIKLRDGGSKIIFFSDTTTVSKTTAGNIVDVAEGSRVFVVGTANTDGSVTAKNIQLQASMPGEEQAR